MPVIDYYSDLCMSIQRLLTGRYIATDHVLTWCIYVGVGVGVGVHIASVQRDSAEACDKMPLYGSHVIGTDQSNAKCCKHFAGAL